MLLHNVGMMELILSIVYSMWLSCVAAFEACNAFPGTVFFQM